MKTHGSRGWQLVLAATFALSVVTVTAQDASELKQLAPADGRSHAACAPLSIWPPTLPAGVVRVAYTQTLTTFGATAPCTYTVTSGSLPQGLTLTPSGVIAGAPEVEEARTFTVTVVDAVGCTASRTYTVPIECSVATCRTEWIAEPRHRTGRA